MSLPARQGKIERRFDEDVHEVFYRLGFHGLFLGTDFRFLFAVFLQLAYQRG